MGESDAIGVQLTHVMALLGREFDQRLQEQFGIGFAQYKILYVLQAHPRIKQKAIACELGQTEASVSRQTKLLQAKGVLTCRIEPTNRRVHVTRLTPKGEHILTAAAEMLERYQGILFDDLKEKDRKRLASSLDALHLQLCPPENHIPHTYAEPLQQL